MRMGYEDPGVSMIVADRIIPRASFHMLDEPDPTPTVIEFVKKHGQRKPTVFTVDFAGGDPELVAQGSSLMARFCRAGIPAFPSPERAMRALAHLYRYHQRCGQDGVLLEQPKSAIGKVLRRELRAEHAMSDD
jgi:acyl-CoA synthetase (NDP forming)